MTLKLLVLFFTPLLSGLLVYLLPSGKTRSYRLLLVFAGAYLFGITVVHILPELYRGHGEVELIGLFVLCGFFLQQILEHFTSGVEHGHIHTHDHAHDHKHSHYHEQVSAIVLLMALCVHAFLEGAMLAQPASGIQYDVNAVLLGIALHRAPAAFALMTVLSFQLHSKNKAIPYLIVFSVAAPIGLLISTYLVEAEILSQSGLVLLYALVSGNFLHISTTIVFESSPEHHFNARKLTVAILGALVAVAVEYFL
ncbi:MAG: ZIP family metal transporter [Cyclobacteriaceae bacterium]|nr:MAG: ZIP family metal transporter [Cyclobacteriaceae bacterium]